MILSTLIAAAAAKRRKKKRKERRKRRPRKQGMSDVSPVLKQLFQASQPGAKKMEFPYEVPEIVTVVKFDKTASSTLITVAGLISVGLVVRGVSQVISSTK